MARLYVTNNNEKTLIKINNKEGLKDSVRLHEIDYLVLYYNNTFIDNAIKNKCVSEDMKNGKLLIKDYDYLPVIMHDQNLYQIAKNLYNNETGVIDSNLDIFKKDMDLLFKLLSNPHCLNKLQKYFKDKEVVEFLSDCQNKSINIINYFKKYENYRDLRVYYNQNIRSLCLVLDKELKKYLVLEQHDKDILDEYTMSFNSSLDIRNKYQESISNYLRQNMSYLNSLSKKNNGYIVLLADSNYGKTRKKVLYKDTKKIIDSILSDLNLVKTISSIDYRNHKNDYDGIFSLYQSKIIYNKRPNIRNGYTKMMQEFKKDLFSNQKYDTIRQIISLAKSNKKKPVSTYQNINIKDNQNDLDLMDETEEYFYPDELIQMSGDEDNSILNSHYQIMKRV